MSILVQKENNIAPDGSSILPLVFGRTWCPVNLDQVSPQLGSEFAAVFKHQQ